MKRSLLFIMPSLSAGGGERSLVNLLAGIDYDRYSVDLYLLNHEGMFMGLLPEQVRLLPHSDSYRKFMLPLASSVKGLIRGRRMRLAASRIMYTLTNRTTSNVGRREQAGWKYLAPSLHPLRKRYDAAIGFLEKTSIYFCVEKANAAVKIGWVHNDYDKLGMLPHFDRRYFRRLDHLVTVSEECSHVLKKRFPELGDRVSVIYNIVSPALIRRMAAASETELYGRRGGETVILSIGRLHPQKGFELAIGACRKLLDRGLKVQWNIIGEGGERERLSALIEENGLRDCFKLLGLRSNPYPYLLQTDIYAQTSRYEGKSIAIDEAKILNKPIVITNFSTARDQIEHGKEGLIADMNPEAIADAVHSLVRDNGLRQRFSARLSELALGTEAEIEKLYRLIG